MEKITYLENEKDLPSIGSTALLNKLKFLIPLPKELKDQEKKRLEKEKLKLEKQIDLFKSKLENETFLSKAPKEIVDNMKSSFDSADTKLKEINSKLESIN